MNGLPRIWMWVWFMNDVTFVGHYFYTMFGLIKVDATCVIWIGITSMIENII